MRTTLIGLGLFFVLGGTIAGCTNWILSNFILEQVNWEGPLVALDTAMWLCNTLGFGIGGMLIGAGSLIATKAQ